MLQCLRRREDVGFTLVETVVALALFGLLVSTVATSLAALLSHTRNNQNRAVAANIAQRIIDRLHAVSAVQLPDGDLPPERYAVDDRVFTVQTSAALTSEGSGAGSSACDGGPGQMSQKRISVIVTWSDMGTTKPVRSDTIRHLTVGELDPTLGTATVKVVDRDNKPARNHVVTLGPGGTTYRTGADGCAVFSRLAPGQYTARLATDRYVDPQGNPAPVVAVSVEANRVTKHPGFVYDQQAQLDIDWVANGDMPDSFPALEGTGATLGNSAFSSGTRAFVQCALGAPCATKYQRGRVVSGLFPAAEGYTAWAGTCLPARPRGAPMAVVLEPGGTGTVPVPLARVTVEVRDQAGSPVIGKTLSFKHDLDTGCPSLTTSPGSGASADVPLPGVSAVKVGLPSGRWRISAGGAEVQLETTAGAMQSVNVVAGP